MFTTAYKNEAMLCARFHTLHHELYHRLTMDYFDQRLWFFMIGALKTNSITGHGNYVVYHSLKKMPVVE
jgi:hypothetical protein